MSQGRASSLAQLVPRPLLRQLQGGYNSQSLELLVEIARQPRLPPGMACELLTWLTGLALGDPLHGRLATVPMLILLGRLGTYTYVPPSGPSA
jgi:hypothetical protein